MHGLQADAQLVLETVINQTTDLTMSNLEIAELTGKEHRGVVRAILKDADGP